MSLAAILLALIALSWCAYLHYYLYRLLLICNKDVMLLNRLLKMIKKSGILAGKCPPGDTLEDAIYDC